MLQFTIQKDIDREGASLRKLLQAHVIYQRMSAAKSFSLHLLALVGVVIWAGEMWPALLPQEWRLAVLALWGGFLVIAVLAAIEEWSWHRKVSRYRAEHQAKQKSAVSP